jgi:hypothetical protein
MGIRGVFHRCGPAALKSTRKAQLRKLAEAIVTVTPMLSLWSVLTANGFRVRNLGLPRIAW